MANLLNLGGLLTVGVGTSSNWQNGLIDLNIPGIVDVAVLPGSDGVTNLLENGLLGSQSAIGNLLGDVGNGLSDLLSGAGGALGGVGGAVGGVGNGLGGALEGIGTGLGGLLGGGVLPPGGGVLPGENGNPNGPGVTIITINGGVSVTGTNGNDFLQGGAGNDKLFGNAGNDILDGASGYDIGIYQGNRADYQVTINGGVTTVADRIATRDGTDTLRNMEFLQFKDGGLDLATGAFVAQAILNETTFAYRAVVRVEAPAGIAETVGVGIAQNKFTFDQYIGALVDDVAGSTIPALLVPALVSGTIPTSDRLDSLTVFAQQQFDYYKNVLGSSAFQLGPYEALGRGLSTTAEFRADYGSGTDSAFLTKAYADVFGSGPSAAQQASLQSQITYFTGLYTGAGLSATQAGLEARGAVYGQIVGYAAYDTGEPLGAKAEVILTGFAKGDASQYGAAFIV